MGPDNTESWWGQTTHSGTRQRKESVGPNNTEKRWGQTTQKTSRIRQHRESKENQRISGSRQHRNRWGWAAGRPGIRENCCGRAAGIWLTLSKASTTPQQTQSNWMGRQYWLVKEFRTSALRGKPQRDSFNTLTAREISEGGRVN